MIYISKSYLLLICIMMNILHTSPLLADAIVGSPELEEYTDIIINGDRLVNPELVNNQRNTNREYPAYIDIRMLPTELSNHNNFGQAKSNAVLTGDCNLVETGYEAAFRTIILSDINFPIPFNQQASWMPEKPGAHSDKTIEGVDLDNDCVRDDIERYIGFKYPRKDQQKHRKYLFEYAKWLGIFIKRNDWSIRTIRSISANVSKIAECVRRIHGSNANTNQLLDEIFAEFHNTFSRSFRYIENRGLLGGWAPRERLTVSCS